MPTFFSSDRSLITSNNVSFNYVCQSHRDRIQRAVKSAVPRCLHVCNLLVETGVVRVCFLEASGFPFPPLSAIEFCDFCCCIAPSTLCFHPPPHPSVVLPVLGVSRRHLLCLTPFHRGGFEKFAWLLGSETDFHATRNTIMGWNEAERYFRPGSNRLFSITGQPRLFVNSKRVMGILCRIVLRAYDRKMQRVTPFLLLDCAPWRYRLFRERKSMVTELSRDYDESMLFGELPSIGFLRLSLL